MKTFCCELDGDDLIISTRDKLGTEKIICRDPKEIIKSLNYIASLKTYLICYSNHYKLVCKEIKTSIDIPKYVVMNVKDVEKCIIGVGNKGCIIKDTKFILSRPLSGLGGEITKVLTSSFLLGSIILSSNLPKQEVINDKPNNDVPPKRPSYSELLPSLVQPTISPDVTKLDLKSEPKQEENISNYNLNINSSTTTTEEEKLEELKEKRQLLWLEEKHRLDMNNKIELMTVYFNVSNIDIVKNFFNEFITTMSGYNHEYSIDDITQIFYETSNIPLENKIEVVKSAFNLTDEQMDAIAATLEAEGVGGGTKYIDVYAATTTALNHLQYPAWVNSITAERGEELGHSLYGHTCYFSQFNGYGSDNYKRFLGDRTLKGYNSVIDALYINYIYGLVLHNYSEFRGSWVDVPNGKIFETGGNKYLHLMLPEDRNLPESMQKNNSK